MLTKQNRFMEIDLLRGVAIALMLVSNFLTDLSFFSIFDLSLNHSLARITAVLFVFTAGISLHLSYERAKQKGNISFFKFFRRGTFIFLLGILVTLVTLLFMKSGFILFGVLHFIGLSVILGYFFVKLDMNKNLFIGIVVLATGMFLYGLRFSFPWLLWLGFIPQGFYTVDFFPLLPWFAFILFGIAVGKRFYPSYRRAFSFPETSGVLVRLLSFAGRNSLKIYLLHQPLFILVIFLLFSEKVLLVLGLP